MMTKGFRTTTDGRIQEMNSEQRTISGEEGDNHEAYRSNH